jgi:hypothetical protein
MMLILGIGSKFNGSEVLAIRKAEIMVNANGVTRWISSETVEENIELCEL